MSDTITSAEEWVGEGRSAVVYLGHDEQGCALARKVFTGESVSKLVLFLLTGSANPYTWCRSAMACAVIRRRILSRLTRVWFGDCLRLPRHDGWGWNEQYLAFELRSELIDGHHAPLRLPDDAGEVDYLKALVDGIMKPLQHHLQESGFDGLVWQAGKGNPVASNNFMLERNTQNGLRWVWIDLESGVPALFAMNPLATLGYYLPKSLKHRRWLFDDVDTNKLKAYLKTQHDQITSTFDEATYEGLLQDFTELELEQNTWRSIRRFRRGIAYQHSRLRLSDAQAEWYQSRPVRWYLHLFPVLAVQLFAALGKGIKRIVRWVKTFPYRHFASRSLRYLSSSKYRWGVARWVISGSIKSWVRRGFLTESAALKLRSELRRDETCGYLTDFSVHLVIKPLVKTIQWGLLPVLWVSGTISELTLGLLLVTGGSIARSLYTLGRMLQAAVRRQRLPWVALLIGLLPVVGNAAYPMQLLHSSTVDTGSLARFIVYDIAIRIGRAIPIWGGSDSQIEHFFNRSCDVIVRKLTLFLNRSVAETGSPVS